MDRHPDDRRFCTFRPVTTQLRPDGSPSQPCWRRLPKHDRAGRSLPVLDFVHGHRLRGLHGAAAAAVLWSRFSPPVLHPPPPIVEGTGRRSSLPAQPDGAAAGTGQKLRPRILGGRIPTRRRHWQFHHLPGFSQIRHCGRDHHPHRVYPRQPLFPDQPPAGRDLALDGGRVGKLARPP